MPNSRVETAEDHMVREVRETAERAVRALVDALSLAGLPPLLGLEGGRITLTDHGVHIELGGCNVRTLLAIAQYLTDHAACAGRVIRGEVVPSGMAELSSVRDELR